MKLKTAGLSPKVPTQAVTTILVAALAYFGIDLDPEVSAALGVLVGFVAGYFAPAAPALPVPGTAKHKAKAKGQAGYGIVELLVALILVLILIWLLFAIVH